MICPPCLSRRVIQCETTKQEYLNKTFPFNHHSDSDRSMFLCVELGISSKNASQRLHLISVWNLSFKMKTINTLQQETFVLIVHFSALYWTGKSFSPEMIQHTAAWDICHHFIDSLHNECIITKTSVNRVPGFYIHWIRKCLRGQTGNSSGESQLMTII